MSNGSRGEEVVNGLDTMSRRMTITAFPSSEPTDGNLHTITMQTSGGVQDLTIVYIYLRARYQLNVVEVRGNERAYIVNGCGWVATEVIGGHGCLHLSRFW